MKSIKILYVEDDKMLGKMTSDILIKTGYYVKWVYQGHHALDALLHETFDICVVDIMLPDLDGYSLVKTIREGNSTMPIIFLTARSLAEDVVKGFKIGGNDYLKKPFAIEELIVRIDAQLKKKPQETDPQPEIFPIGNYTFYYKSMMLSIESKDYIFTHLENELLYQLVTNDIMQRQKCLSEIWGSDSFFNTRSMDVYISKLRKYLSSDSSVSIINIRAMGYKLVIRKV